jgi:hypothetical protein
MRLATGIIDCAFRNNEKELSRFVVLPLFYLKFSPAQNPSIRDLESFSPESFSAINVFRIPGGFSDE